MKLILRGLGQALGGVTSTSGGRLFSDYDMTTIGFARQQQCSRFVAMAKTTPLGVRLEEDVRKALTKAAKDDSRSVSSLLSKIVTDWLKENSYLKK